MGLTPWEWVKIGFFFCIGFSAFKLISFIILAIASIINGEMYSIPID